ncbi:hypothetical protein CRU99_10245 [Malaciobacter mytili]|uniref:hypothetical protein n=1 Tax=Malaciobacter mytili TaxID=603050 RepID=UPI00100B4BC7|nr:hypothetical protein [Malaciobacter mytili]RXI40681.1 hypothetical protein CRU99_10245 [Malaciobacter mytili]
MNKLIKYLVFILFLFSIIVLINTNSFSKISNSILTLLPKSEEKSFLQEYDKFKSSKLLLLSVKGLEKESYNKTIKLEEELSKIEGLTLKKVFYNNQLETYKQEFKLYYKEFDKQRFENINIKQELTTLYENLNNSFFPILIDKQDPFKLFKDESLHLVFNLKNSHITIGDFGYISFFMIDEKLNSLQEYKKLYNRVNSITKNYQEIIVFSPIFYYVENEKAIKDDVNKIILIATIILLLLYLVILRNFSLLLNTLTALATSTILSIVIVTSLFNEISIFVIVFGISISTVAIDYMFHNYIHGYYSNNKKFNKEVFYGFLTTLLVFFTISFVSFDLITHICIFAVISLTISYLQFSFLFPKIGFLPKQNKTFSLKLELISPKIIFIFSLIVLIVFSQFITFDLNLKNLDYDNKVLKEKEEFFNKNLKEDNIIKILITAKNIDELILNIEKIKQEVKYIKSPLAYLVNEEILKQRNTLLQSKEFLQLKNTIGIEASKLGFRKDFFTDAYKIQEKTITYDTIEELKQLNIDIIKHNNSLLSYVTIKKDELKNIEKFEFVYPLSMTLLFEKSLLKVKNELLFFGAIALIIIFSLLFIITKKEFLNSFNYIVFPLCLIFISSYFIEFNILHIFMIFILLSFSIDYGIYTSKRLDKKTKEAIIYSLLSTFAGFGVLIFSKINSLKAIGVIATIGIIAIALLLIFSKRSNNETNCA